MKIIKVSRNNVSYDNWIRTSKKKSEWIRIGNDMGYFFRIKQALGDICKKMDMPFLQMDLEDVLEKGIDQIEDVGEDVHEEAIEIHQDLYEIRDKYKLSDTKFMIIWRFFSSIFGLF
jgi:hypothetical protein